MICNPSHLNRAKEKRVPGTPKHPREFAYGMWLFWTDRSSCSVESYFTKINVGSRAAHTVFDIRWADNGAIITWTPTICKQLTHICNICCAAYSEIRQVEYSVYIINGFTHLFTAKEHIVHISHISCNEIGKVKVVQRVAIPEHTIHILHTGSVEYWYIKRSTLSPSP